MLVERPCCALVLFVAIPGLSTFAASFEILISGRSTAVTTPRYLLAVVPPVFCSLRNVFKPIVVGCGVCPYSAAYLGILESIALCIFIKAFDVLIYWFEYEEAFPFESAAYIAELQGREVENCVYIGAGRGESENGVQSRWCAAGDIYSRAWAYHRHVHRAWFEQIHFEDGTVVSQGGVFSDFIVGAFESAYADAGVFREEIDEVLEERH